MKSKKGIITSAKMTGTVTVTVHRNAVHSKYRKRYRVSKKYLADPNGHENLREGDEVIISECSPISKNKYCKVTEIVKRVPNVSDLKEEEGLEEALRQKGTEGTEVSDTLKKSENSDTPLAS
jgi:small subunit ribosomal protein S17